MGLSFVKPGGGMSVYLCYFVGIQLFTICYDINNNKRGILLYY